MVAKILMCLLMVLVTSASATHVEAKSEQNVDAILKDLVSQTTKTKDWRTLTLAVEQAKALPGGCPRPHVRDEGIIFFGGQFIIDFGRGFVAGDDRVDGTEFKGQCSIDIETECRSGYFLVPDESLWAFPGSIAAYATFISFLANAYRVPPNVTGDFVESIFDVARNAARGIIEKRQTDDHEPAVDKLIYLERSLALAWNAYRERSKRQSELPILAYNPGCGATPPVFAKITASPPGARIRIIATFDWLLCRAQRRDPWDPDVCLGWSDVVTDQTDVSGSYHYVAVWEDGTTRRSEFTIIPGAGPSDSAVLIRR